MKYNSPHYPPGLLGSTVFAWHTRFYGHMATLILLQAKIPQQVQWNWEGWSGVEGHVAQPALSKFTVVLCNKPNLLDLGSSTFFLS